MPLSPDPPRPAVNLGFPTGRGGGQWPRRLARDDERPVLIWTDGASEPTSARPHTMGFVVAVPRAGSPGMGSGLSGLAPLQAYYDIYHG